MGGSGLRSRCWPTSIRGGASEGRPAGRLALRPGRAGSFILLHACISGTQRPPTVRTSGPLGQLTVCVVTLDSTARPPPRPVGTVRGHVQRLQSSRRPNHLLTCSSLSGVSPCGDREEGGNVDCHRRTAHPTLCPPRYGRSNRTTSREIVEPQWTRGTVMLGSGPRTLPISDVYYI